MTSMRGWHDVQERLAEHRRGEGAVLTKHASDAGCGLVLARVWDDAAFGKERSMKRHELTRYCHICKDERSREPER